MKKRDNAPIHKARKTALCPEKKGGERAGSEGGKCRKNRRGRYEPGSSKV